MTQAQPAPAPAPAAPAPATPAQVAPAPAAPTPAEPAKPETAPASAEVEAILKKLAEAAAKVPESQPAPSPQTPQPAAQPPASDRAQPAPGTPMPAMNGQDKGVPLAPASPAAGAATSKEASPPSSPPDEVRLEFTEGTEVQILVKYVQDQLGLKIIATDGGLAGQKIFFNEPIVIKRRDLLRFLINVLESKEYTLTEDAMGILTVQPKNAMPAGFGVGALSPTRIIHVPGMKPSSLQGIIQQILNVNRAGGVNNSQPTYMDEIGVIVLTETPRNTQLVQDLVDRMVEERKANKFHRLTLTNLAASSAKDRLLELIGQTSQRTGGVSLPNAPQQPVNQPGVASIGGSMANFAERLIIDAASNGLFFRGRADEAEMVRDLLALVDVPNNMVSRWYPVGLSTAEAVASAGRREQLGDVTTFESSGSNSGGSGVAGRAVGQAIQGQPNAGAFGQPQQELAGAGFVLYPEAGGFIYRGTETQHERVGALVSTLKDLSEKDRVVLEFYKLKHGKATDVAEVVQNLLNNSSATGNRGGLLGRELGSSRTRSPSSASSGSSRPRSPSSASSGASGSRNTPRQPNQPAGATAGGAGGAGGADAGLGEIDGAEVFVIADEPNNQVVVKAPAKLQTQFRQLITRIDLRRPQVYIDAKIVAITDSDDFRLAVDTQNIIGSFALQSTFGLSAADTLLTNPRIPAANNRGFTAALIRSRDVPLVINALANNTNSRIIASPQLLVDDNEEAEISSLDQQPTATTTQSSTAGSTQTGFQGFESAGPKLTVRPQIAEGGYMRLEYEIELSSFTGSSAGNLPPPKQENKIRSDSVTVPSDTTIVVGGLTFDTQSKTVVKIPLIGDIPLVGELFRDTSTTNRKTTLYVFITPKIMRDPSFADLRLLTKNPLTAVGLAEELPPAEPERIDIVDAARDDSEKLKREAIEQNRRRALDIAVPKK